MRRKESQGNGGANANSIVFNGYGSSKTRIKGSQKQKFHVSKGEDANENDVFLFLFFVVLECTHDHLTSVYTEFVSFIYFSFISFGVGLFLYENQENKKKQRYQLTYKII